MGERESVRSVGRQPKPSSVMVDGMVILSTCETYAHFKEILENLNQHAYQFCF